MTQPSPRRVTLRDVAMRAGVSSQTVSRVMHASPLVSGELRQRVQRAIADLDYQPNQAARNLKYQRSRLITVFLFDEGYPVHLNRLVARGRGLGYRLVHEYNIASNADTFRLAMEEAMTQMAEGILLFSVATASHTEAIARLNRRDIPIVYVDTYLAAHMPAPRSGEPMASVVINQYHGTQLAVEHLIALGHRDIAEIAGPVTRLVDAQERHASWVATMRAHGLSPALSVMHGDGGFHPGDGYAAMQALLARHERFTAVVCANDNLAIGAIHALWEAGKRVPQDCSVVGFDDRDIARYAIPSLTTVRQDFDALAAAGLEYLVELIADPTTSLRQKVFEPELIVRASTAPPHPGG